MGTLKEQSLYPRGQPALSAPSLWGVLHICPSLTDAEGHSAASTLVRFLVACSSMFLATAEIQPQESGEADKSIRLIRSVDTVPWRTGRRTGLPCWERKGSIVSGRSQTLVRRP